MKIRSFYRAFHQAALISSVERRLPKARDLRTGITGGRSPGYAIEEPNSSIPEGLPLLLSRKCATHSNLARPARQVNLASPGNLANREKVASPGNLASPGNPANRAVETAVKLASPGNLAGPAIGLSPTRPVP